MFFDQFQIITSGVESDYRHLVAPFLDFEALHFWKQAHVFRHELRSYLRPNVFPTSLQLFHELANQLCRVFFTDVCGLSFKGVSDVHRNRHVRIFDHERRCRLLSLICVAVRLEIVQDRVQIASCLGLWRLNIYFPYFTSPCLDYTVSGLP